MKIIFVRHGEINLKTGTLNRNGIKQIKSAGKYLKNENVDAIFCSPKTRAIQSANILKQQLNAEIFIEKNFNERQILTSSQRTLYGQEFDQNYLNYNFQSQNYETCRDFIDRNFEGFLNILKLSNLKAFKEMADPTSLFKFGALWVRDMLENGELNLTENKNGKPLKLFPDSTILIVAHSSTLYAINAFINGIPKSGQINWLQCNNGAVVKFYI